MPLNQGYLHNKSEAFTELAAELDLATLEELRKVTNRLTEDPDLEFEDRIRDFAEQETEKWYEKASTWINANLSLVYLRAINMQDRELAEMVGAPRFQDNPIPLARFSEHARITGEISDEAKKVLSKYPKHWDSYKRYEATFKEAMNKIRLPFRNSTVQNYRDIAALRMQPAFQEGGVATRKDLAQDVLNEFADRGINVVQFPNRKMSVEAFANREARAYMQDVAVQGQINRATQRGYDLVRINSYAGPSPMCAPHQGNVYSLSGNSSQYPPLSSAIHDGTYSYGSGIYHSYCGHFQSTYIPGVSEGIQITDDPEEQRILNEMGESQGNRYIYQRRQELRDMEYTLRTYRRRKTAALTKPERERHNKLINRWQGRIDQHLDEYDFLKQTRGNLLF